MMKYWEPYGNKRGEKREKVVGGGIYLVSKGTGSYYTHLIIYFLMDLLSR